MQGVVIIIFKKLFCDLHPCVPCGSEKGTFLRMVAPQELGPPQVRKSGSTEFRTRCWRANGSAVSNA